MTVRDHPQINLPPEDVMADVDSADMISFACPQCGYEMMRVQRWAIDNLLSMFAAVHRFRCTNLACGYECKLKN